LKIKFNFENWVKKTQILKRLGEEGGEEEEEVGDL
jgi:hypothetical protein